MHVTIPITLVCICILALRRGITRHLTKNAISLKTKRMHCQLLTTGNPIFQLRKGMRRLSREPCKIFKR
ncbi:unnamed protein product [Strongylus vulgaris]|uniref:Secreted protein n=1 Tax=Strongylus vulgaris TaxID=40348 RepID=A0A3P7JDG7_STRVU|nr:unnamed protein product [Strongylus vulgaris]